MHTRIAVLQHRQDNGRVRAVLLFLDADEPPREVAKKMGYEAPTKTEHSGAIGVMHMTPDEDEALREWLLVRDDPRVVAVIAELRGEP